MLSDVIEYLCKKQNITIFIVVIYYACGSSLSRDVRPMANVGISADDYKLK